MNANVTSLSPDGVNLTNKRAYSANFTLKYKLTFKSEKVATSGGDILTLIVTRATATPYFTREAICPSLCNF